MTANGIGIETGSGFGAATFNVVDEVIGKGPLALTGSGFCAAIFSVAVDVMGIVPEILTGNVPLA
jgi:hypothetical protein